MLTMMQVITGFLGTAWLCNSFVLVHYLLIFDTHQNIFGEDRPPAGAEQPSSWNTNPMDILSKSLLAQCRACPGSKGYYGSSFVPIAEGTETAIPSAGPGSIGSRGCCSILVWFAVLLRGFGVPSPP